MASYKFGGEVTGDSQLGMALNTVESLGTNKKNLPSLQDVMAIVPEKKKGKVRIELNNIGYGEDTKRDELLLKFLVGDVSMQTIKYILRADVVVEDPRDLARQLLQAPRYEGATP